MKKEQIFINAKVKKIDSKIKKAIKKAGIEYPYHSLGFFKATYAKFEEANGNKVILADSVKDDVKYLIGTQMNRDHLREGHIMGHIIDAYVTKNDEIEIVFTFAKNVYADQYEEALSLLAEDKLTVSFELKVAKDDVEHMAHGVRRLTKVEFDGVGLLFGIKPAYKNAYVLETAMKIIENAFNQKDKQLVYASAKDIVQKWTRIGELIETALIEKETKSEGDFEMKDKLQADLLAEYKPLLTKEFGEEIVKDWTDEDFLNQAKIDEIRESLKTAEVEDEEVVEDEVVKDEVVKDVVDEVVEEVAEVENEEVVEDEAVEEVAEKTVVEKDSKVKETITYDDETNEEKIETEAEVVIKRDGQEKFRETVNKETVYTYAQVEAIKSEYEAVVQAKEDEIAFLRENAQEIVKLRTELADFATDLSDEDILDETKQELARLKKENSELKASQVVTAKDEEVEEDEVADDDLQTTTDEVVPEVVEETKEEIVSDYLKAKYGNKKKK